MNRIEFYKISKRTQTPSVHITAEKVEIKMSDAFEYEEEEVNDNENEEIDAILHMDFERALEISRRQFNTNDDFYDEESHYEEQSQLLTQQVFDNYNSELSQISQDYLNDAEYYKTLWQDYCKKLVSKHREEADLLEQRWRSARAAEIARASDKAQTEFATARVLAMCKLYDSAIDLKNKVQSSLEMKKTPELRILDREYATQYKKMTQRHYSEFQFLYQHLKSLMKTLRQRAESLKKTAEANLEVEKARNTTLIIQAVSRDKVSQQARERILQNFSPRTRGTDSQAMSLCSPRGRESRLSGARSTRSLKH